SVRCPCGSLRRTSSAGKIRALPSAPPAMYAKIRSGATEHNLTIRWTNRTLRSHRHDRLPTAHLGRVEDGVADRLRRQGLAERGAGGLTGGEVLEEVGHVVHEGVLVANLEARHPPVLHVGLVAVGNVDRPPAADDRVVAVVEVLESVQVVQVPLERGLLAVD